MELLKYLDLALPSKEGKLVMEKELNIRCYFKHPNHVMNGNNPYMNTLIDLIISLGNNLEKSSEQINKINSHIHNCIFTRNKLLQELITNIDYIKSQNNEIIGYLNNIKTLNKESKMSVLIEEMRNIYKHYDKIKFLLEEIKHISIT